MLYYGFMDEVGLTVTKQGPKSGIAISEEELCSFKVYHFEEASCVAQYQQQSGLQ